MYKARETGAGAFALGDDELNVRDDELASFGVCRICTARGNAWGESRTHAYSMRGLVGRGRRSEVLGNAGYCRIGEWPGTPDSGSGTVG